MKQVVKLLPTSLRLEVGARDLPIRLTNQSPQAVHALHFALYNKRKFRFDPAQLSLQPLQTKLVYVSLVDEEPPAYETKDFAYLKSQKSDISIKVTLYVSGRSRDNSRSRERPSQLDQNPLNNLSYIERLKESMDHKQRFFSREDTMKLQFEDSDKKRPFQTDAKITKERAMNQNLLIKLEDYSSRIEMLESELQCKEENYQTEKQRNKLLNQKLANREEEIRKLVEGQRWLNDEVSRVHGLQKLFYEKSQESLRLRQQFEAQSEEAKRKFQKTLEDLQLRSIDLKRQLTENQQIFDSDKKRLQQDNQIVRRRRDQLEREVLELRQKLSQAEHALLLQRTSNQQLRQDKQLAEKQNSELKYKCEYFVSNLQRYEKELLDKRGQLIRLRVESNTNSQIIPEISEEAKREKEERERISTNLQAVKDEERLSRNRILQLQMELSQNSKHLKDVLDQLAACQKMGYEQDDKNREARKRLEIRVEDLQSQLQIKQRVLDEVQSRLEQHEINNREKEQGVGEQLEHARDLIEGLEKESTKFETVNHQLRRENLLLLQKVGILESQVEKREFMINNRLQESVNVETYKQSIRGRLKDLEEFTRQRVDKLERKRKKADSKVSQLTEQNVALKKALLQLKRKKQAVVVQESQLAEIVNNFENQKSQLIDENTQMRSILTDMENSYKEAKAQARQVAEQNQIKEEEVSKLAGMMDTMRHQMRTQAESCKKAGTFLKDKFQILKNRLINEFKHNLGQIQQSDKNKDIISCIQRRTDALENVSHKEAVIHSLSNKNKALKSDLARTREQIRELEHHINDNRYCSRMPAKSLAKPETCEIDAIHVECQLITEQCKNAELIGQLSQLNEKLSQCENQLYTTTQDLEKYQAKCKTHEEEMKKISRQCKQELKRIKEVVESQQEEQVIQHQQIDLSKPKKCKACKNKKSELQRVRADLISSNLRCKSLEKDLEGAMDQLRSKDSSASGYQRDPQSYRKSQLIKELRQRLQQQSNSLSTLKGLFKQLSKDLKRKQATIQSLKSSVKGNQERKELCQKTQEQLKVLQTEQQKIRHQLKGEQEENRRLKKELVEEKGRSKESEGGPTQLMMLRSQCSSLSMVIRRIYGDLQWRLRKSGTQLQLQSPQRANTQTIYQQVASLIQTIKD